MTQRFKDKTAFVTGAASGIGRAISERLVLEGANVVGGDINRAELDALARNLGDRFSGVKCDVTIEGDIAAAVETAISRFGGLDLAFNNAGTHRLADIIDMPTEDWDLAQNICLRGTFLGIKYQGRHIRPGGAIVNTASVNAFIPAKGFAAYTAAKAGVEMLTRNAALELAGRKIRVNAILPGLVATPPTKVLMDDALVNQRFMERIAMGRAGEPTEIASAALYLASDEASYITGAGLVVDGGWSLTSYPDIEFFLRDFHESLEARGEQQP